MHPLQDLFATAEGERSFDDRLHALFEVGDLAAAEALLTADLATLDGEIARICRELPREAVTLDGWEDLAEAIELHEGAAVTGITLAIANDPELAFEKGRLQEPFVAIGLHTDETFAFSEATPEALLAEARAANGAAWEGQEEDIELYLEVSGFGPLNTALLGHIQRHFLRDGSTEPAPLSYVDYVIGCWWRALRFQQAIATECARYGVPGGAPVVASTVDMRPELTTVHLAAAPAAPAPRRTEAPRMADLAHVLEAVQIERTPLVVETPPIAEPASVEETVFAKTAPTAEAMPFAEAAATEEWKPFPVAAPADESTPLAEAVPIEETTPAAGSEPFEVTASLAEDAPIVDLAPVEEATPFAEVAPIEDVAPFMEAPAEEPEPFVETASAEIAAPLAEVAPVEETAPARAETAPIVEPLELDVLEELEEEEEEEEPESAQMAEISPARFIPRKPIEEEAKPTGTGLRRRLAESEPVEKSASRWGFLSRLFGRSQSYDEAA